MPYRYSSHETIEVSFCAFISIIYRKIRQYCSQNTFKPSQNNLAQRSKLRAFKLEFDKCELYKLKKKTQFKGQYKVTLTFFSDIQVNNVGNTKFD